MMHDVLQLREEFVRCAVSGVLHVVPLVSCVNSASSNALMLIPDELVLAATAYTNDRRHLISFSFSFTTSIFGPVTAERLCLAV